MSKDEKLGKSSIGEILSRSNHNQYEVDIWVARELMLKSVGDGNSNDAYLAFKDYYRLIIEL